MKVGLRKRCGLAYRWASGRSIAALEERLRADDDFVNGGASRARTDGLVVANDALSQLSYSPTKR